ncbi:L,D-transpeptidase [Psychromarinibacter sp. C21-152]|uniref:L,D-transpeptidase n=1 Tax=Psychromarinibacter sediminicola TaxID=3033385 RepID=A0AAE3TCG7_9RHOB|nr:L,D-transpeptidase [Psychromarinibacter sediminicola]MDF0603625.1 L,D-transpeptidase [Psychromarinibacter sediminicola]
MERRGFLVTGLAAALAATGAPAPARDKPGIYYLPRKYVPRVVAFDRGRPGEIHVIPDDFALFFILPEGKAIRYAVGIGRPGFYRAGEFYVGAKREWPSWTPTRNMIRRDPETYGPYAGGVPGGRTNPLGARALYLYQRGRGDTLLRIHGTNVPRSIGHRVSSGCTRLINKHVIDLYDRVALGARVVLYPEA